MTPEERAATISLDRVNNTSDIRADIAAAIRAAEKAAERRGVETYMIDRVEDAECLARALAGLVGVPITPADWKNPADVIARAAAHRYAAPEVWTNIRRGTDYVVLGEVRDANNDAPLPDPQQLYRSLDDGRLYFRDPAEFEAKFTRKS